MAERKIIFVNRVYWPNESATAQLLTDLAPALAAKGHVVHVVTGGHGEGQHDGVTVHRTGGENRVDRLGRRVVSYGRFLWQARRIIRRLATVGDTVVLKTDPPLLAPMLTSLARRRGARVIQWIQDIYPEIARRHGGGWLAPLTVPLQAWRDSAWRRAAMCVVPGEDMQETVALRGVSRARLQVLPNWAPRELGGRAPDAAIAALRARRGWTERFVIAYYGNLGRVHEFATLLDAAELVRDDPAIVFAFIGGGARHREVERQARARGLDNVTFLPPAPRAELAQSLAAADMHAVTLLPGFEGLVHPSKVAGALAAGRPIVFVGPVSCALAGLLHRTAAGVAFAPGNSRGLADCLRRWRQDPSQPRAAGQAARWTFESNFRFEEIAAAWDALLRDDASGPDGHCQ